MIEKDEFDAVGYCPFTPDHNSTAVLTKDKTYYSATVLDIQGRDEAIYRPMGNRALRTKKYNSKWLNGNFASFFLIHILAIQLLNITYNTMTKRKYLTMQKIFDKTLDIEKPESDLKNWCELRCSGKVSSSCSTSGTVMLHLFKIRWYNYILLTEMEVYLLNTI